MEVTSDLHDHPPRLLPDSVFHICLIHFFKSPHLMFQIKKQKQKKKEAAEVE